MPDTRWPSLGHPGLPGRGPGPRASLRTVLDPSEPSLKERPVACSQPFMGWDCPRCCSPTLPRPRDSRPLHFSHLQHCDRDCDSC